MRAQLIAVGLLVGFVIGALFATGIGVYATTNYHHDPVKLLALRDACLAHDVSAFLSYCNDYAERYSRVPGRGD